MGQRRAESKEQKAGMRETGKKLEKAGQEREEGAGAVGEGRERGKSQSEMIM